MTHFSKIETLESEIHQLQSLLNCRAGKLLLKGKPFVVVANDEPYYTGVYELIREAEKAKGRWTDECEEAFQDACPNDNGGYFPMPTPELTGLLRDQRRLNDLQTKLGQIKRIVDE